MRAVLLSLLLSAAAPAWSAADATQMLPSGWMRLEVGSQWDSRVLQEKVGNDIRDVGQIHLVAPVRLYLGGGDGVQGVVELPVVWNSLQKSSGTTSQTGLGDLAVGVKVKLLEDTGTTPSFLIQTMLKFPTGKSAFETYVMERLNEEGGRGTGSGSFDLEVSAVVSAYLRPFETYLILELDQRGSNEIVVEGIPRRVDYGNRSSVVTGMEMDLAERFALALEARADVYAADVWTEGGVDMTAGQGADLKLFRDEALAEADLYLGTTTEWFLGPRLDWRATDDTKLSVRAEAGLTPDSPQWRVAASLSSAFNTRLSLGGLFGRKAAPGAASDSVSGNLQRYIFTRYEEAERARKREDWPRLAEAVAVLEELHPVPEDLRPGIKAQSEALFLRASRRVQDGHEAAKRGDWAAAVRAWREALRLRKGFEPAASALESGAKAVKAEAQRLYLKGVDAYVKDEDPLRALPLWEQAQELDPEDGRIGESIERARRKARALGRLP